MAVLTIDNVTKRYGDFTAVDRVSFEVQSGRILGLLGPNGAGKTSTIRMIAYITAPAEGEIRFGDEVMFSSDDNVFVPPERRRVGFVPQEALLSVEQEPRALVGVRFLGDSHLL